MPPTKDQALCLRQIEWSETSQIVWLFALDLGIVRAVAKGSRRPGERFSGGLELLTRGEAILYLKPGAELATLAAWDLVEVLAAPRRTLEAFYAGMYLADLTLRLLQERDPHPRLFDALLRSLRAPPDATAAAVVECQWAALDECGYRPKLDADIESSGALSDASASFLPRRGGFTSRRTTESEPAWRVRPQTMAVLRLLDLRGRNGAEVVSLALTDLQRAARLLDAYAREILGRDVPAAEALFGVWSSDATGRSRRS
ncbi:MAG: DNA repair protein RecO [Phycisphaerales bacterium]